VSNEKESEVYDSKSPFMTTNLYIYDPTYIKSVILEEKSPQPNMDMLQAPINEEEKTYTPFLRVITS
jgi:hypothetical protein